MWGCGVCVWGVVCVLGGVDVLQHAQRAAARTARSSAAQHTAHTQTHLFLEPAEHLWRHARELAQRALARPHAVRDLLAQRERLVGQARPAALEADLEQAAHQAARALRHVHHVAREREAVELQARHVRLQQHVDLGRRLVEPLLDRHGHAVDELGELELLLLAHNHELLGVVAGLLVSLLVLFFGG